MKKTCHVEYDGRLKCWFVWRATKNNIYDLCRDGKWRLFSNRHKFYSRAEARAAVPQGWKVVRP